jgi:hypothetical protein
MSLFSYFTSRLLQRIESKKSDIDFRENSPIYFSDYIYHLKDIHLSKRKLLPSMLGLFLILTVALSIFPIDDFYQIAMYTGLLFVWFVTVYLLYVMSFSISIYDTDRIKIRQGLPFPRTRIYSLKNLKYIETRWKIRGKAFFYFLVFQKAGHEIQKVPLMRVFHHEAIFYFLSEKRAIPFFTNRYYVRDYWNKHWDVILLWSYVAICYLYPFLYGLQIFLFILFPLLRHIYRRIYDIPNYKKHNRKTRYNVRAFWFMVWISILLPIAGFDLPWNFYQKNLQFNCLILNTYSNNYMIQHYRHWQRTSQSLPILVHQIQTCDLKDKTPFLLYLIKEHEPFGSILQPSMASALNYYPNAYMVKRALEAMYHQKFPVFNTYFPDPPTYNMNFDSNSMYHDIQNEVMAIYDEQAQ